MASCSILCCHGLGLGGVGACVCALREEGEVSTKRRATSLKPTQMQSSMRIISRAGSAAQLTEPSDDPRPRPERPPAAASPSSSRPLPPRFAVLRVRLPTLSDPTAAALLVVAAASLLEFSGWKTSPDAVILVSWYQSVGTVSGSHSPILPGHKQHPPPALHPTQDRPPADAPATTQGCLFSSPQVILCAGSTVSSRLTMSRASGLTLGGKEG